jgi:Nucleotidyl transferase AbiEii toxin, Type IV TA system
MTEYTRPATWEDVKTLARLLDEAGVEYALVGGYALAAHGYNRFTEDVDLLVDPSRENTSRWIAALAKLPDGATRELTGEDDIFEKQGPYAVRINDEFTVDLLPAACGHGWDELRQFVTEKIVDGVSIKVLDLRGLLLTKEGMRPQDQADALLIRRALGQE